MIEELIEKTKAAAFYLSNASTDEKNQALSNIAEAIISHKEAILGANKIDLEMNKDTTNQVMLKRLELNNSKIDQMVSSINDLIYLSDPIGERLEDYLAPSGIRIIKERVPFGLLAVIYEARPNVTVDIAALAIKTGNACLLKGGKEASNTSKLLVQIMKHAIDGVFPSDIINYIDNREATKEVLTNKQIDLLIPRGSKNLIDYVTHNAKVPVIETGAGVCHIYIDEDCDDNMAINIVANAKLSNPAVCNSLETLLISRKKHYLLKQIIDNLPEVKIKSIDELEGISFETLATMDEYHTEYNDLILAIKVVDDVNQAVDHISKYSTHHSDAIISNNLKNVEFFLNKVDSACVYVNASTRFTDGGCFGFGAEVGISTSKLHARGPMGLKELTTYKYKIYGSGQTR